LAEHSERLADPWRGAVVPSRRPRESGEHAVLLMDTITGHKLGGGEWGEYEYMDDGGEYIYVSAFCVPLVI